MIGVDLFFNAGLFAPLLDQESEPSLLSDEQLFQRIPVAYFALLAAVVAAAWLSDRLEVSDTRSGIVLGVGVGALFSLMGVVYMWTAIEMTGVFVAAASLVLMAEFASAGWTLSAHRRGTGIGSKPSRVILIAVLLAVGGVVIQNLQS
jgi:hypothetical protein